MIKRCVARAHKHPYTTIALRASQTLQVCPAPTLQAPRMRTPPWWHDAEALAPTTHNPKAAICEAQGGEAHPSSLLACCGKAHRRLCPSGRTPLQPQHTAECPSLKPAAGWPWFRRGHHLFHENHPLQTPLPARQPHVCLQLAAAQALLPAAAPSVWAATIACDRGPVCRLLQRNCYR